MTTALARPMFIVLEGLDGAGKTTCASYLAELLGARLMTTPSPEIRAWRDIVVGGFGGNQEAAQLFYLSTVFAASEEVRRALASGQSVVMDRYFLSTQAYAEFRGSRLGLDELGEQLMPADLTVYLDAPARVRESRLLKRSHTAADLETLSTGASERLRQLHRKRHASPVVGRWLELENAGVDPQDAVLQIVAAAAALSRHDEEART